MEGPDSEFLLYQSEDGQTNVQVRVQDETVWLSQRQMAELFDKAVPTINEHISNVFAEGELEMEATIRNFRIVQIEGDRSVERNIEHYNLDVIISVGYRVRSHRGTQFRIWATKILREYIIKGFALDDERLQEGRQKDYFQELLERIRAIRASERQFYQKITDIYATAVDYDKGHAITRDFFASVQNKMHWAIHGHTAAEVIAERADSSQPNMGLTTWTGGPGKKLKQADAKVAKNYLSEDELRQLNRLATSYLDYAEAMAERRRAMTMTDWKDRLDAFLSFNEHEILDHAGTVSHEQAAAKALGEFTKYDEARRKHEAENPTSDFDLFLEQTKRLEHRPDSS